MAPAAAGAGASLWGDGWGWLLTVDIAGRTYRFAERATDLDSADGPLHFEGRLQGVDFAREAPTLGEEAEATATADVIWPVSLAGLFLAGAPVHAARAELAVIARGQTFERRVVVARGAAEFDGYPLRDAPASLTIEQGQGVDRGSMIDPGLAISKSTWANSPDGSSRSGKSTQGQLYPLLFGSPGYDYITATARAGFPIYPVLEDLSTPRHVFALCQGSATATTAEIFCAEQTLRNAAPLTVSIDSRGQTVTTYDTGLAGTAVGASPEQADQAFACLGSAGGPASPYRPGPLTAATDVLRWAVERSTVEWDLGSIVGAGEVLDRYRLDGYLDAQATPLDYVRSELLPILPIALVPGPRGLAVSLIGRSPSAGEAVAHLEQARNAWATSDALTAETTPDDVIGAVAISYDYRPRDGSYGRRQTLTGSPATAAAATAPTAQVSTALSGLEGNAAPGIVEVSTALVSRQDVAGLIAQDILAARRSPRASRSYRVGPALAHVAPGQAVLLTDSDLSLSRVPVRVLRWEIEAGAWVLTVELLPRRP
jgi:hypothetical protein